MDRPTQHLKGIYAMNWDRIEGQWKQRRGKATHHWGKVMNDELAAIAGKYEALVGSLQEKYGIAKEEAKKNVAEFRKSVEQLKKSNSKLFAMQKAVNKAGKSSRPVARAKATPRKRVRVKSRR
jgi:uncharacterized protein YjbJ (UPF0337 family)